VRGVFSLVESWWRLQGKELAYHPL
jgi:hypothetical protein